MKEIVLPLFAMIVIFVVPAGIGLTAVILWFKHRSQINKNIYHAIEQGAQLEVIERLIEMDSPKRTKENMLPKRNGLASGIVLLVILIIAFFLAWYLVGDHVVTLYYRTLWLLG